MSVEVGHLPTLSLSDLQGVLCWYGGMYVTQMVRSSPWNVTKSTDLSLFTSNHSWWFSGGSVTVVSLCGVKSIHMGVYDRYENMWKVRKCACVIVTIVCANKWHRYTFALRHWFISNPCANYRGSVCSVQPLHNCAHSPLTFIVLWWVKLDRMLSSG